MVSPEPSEQTEARCNESASIVQSTERDNMADDDSSDNDGDDEDDEDDEEEEELIRPDKTFASMRKVDITACTLILLVSELHQFLAF